MKKIIYISILIGVFSGCRKDYPESDYTEYPMCIGCNSTYYTAYYILNDINTKFINNDTINTNDTLDYNSLYASVNMEGFLITDQTYEYWASDGRYRPIHTQPYFINKIKDYKIFANGVNINSGIKILIRDKTGNYFASNLLGEKIGYSPLKIEFTDTANVIGKISFKIEITDDKDNIFTTKTDSVYILK